MPDIFNQATDHHSPSQTKSGATPVTRSAQKQHLSLTREKVRVKPKFSLPQHQTVTKPPIDTVEKLKQVTTPLSLEKPESIQTVDCPQWDAFGSGDPQGQASTVGNPTSRAGLSGVTKHVDEYSEVMRQEKPGKSHFRAYVPKPVDVTFTSQVPKEQIILILRQHPITQLKSFLAVLGMILGYFFLNWLGFFAFLPAHYHIGITLFWFLIVIGFSFATLLKWLYNMYIITDERIIDVDVYSLLERNLTSAKIDHIQDVTAANYGLLGSIFNVGIVVVQTAGAHPMLEFGGVPQPARVVTLINELMLEEEREKLEGRVI